MKNLTKSIIGPYRDAHPVIWGRYSNTMFLGLGHISTITYRGSNVVRDIYIDFHWKINTEIIRLQDHDLWFPVSPMLVLTMTSMVFTNLHVLRDDVILSCIGANDLEINLSSLIEIRFFAEKLLKESKKTWHSEATQ